MSTITIEAKLDLPSRAYAKRTSSTQSPHTTAPAYAGAVVCACCPAAVRPVWRTGERPDTGDGCRVFDTRYRRVVLPEPEAVPEAPAHGRFRRMGHCLMKELETL
jgi:hypothetical protein